MNTPTMTGDRRADAEQAIRLVGELQSIGQGIGKLQARLRRCRVGSPKFQDYERRLTELENRHSEITHFVNLILALYGGIA